MSTEQRFHVMLRLICFLIVLVFGRDLQAQASKTVVVSNRVSFRFADFADLLPQVLAKGRVEVVIWPNRRIGEFEKLFFASSETARGVYIDEIGLASVDFLKPRPFPPGKSLNDLFSDAKLQDKKITILSLAFTHFEASEFADARRHLAHVRAIEAGGSLIQEGHLRVLAASSPKLIALDISDTQLRIIDLLRVCGVRQGLRAASLGGIPGTSEEFCELLKYWPNIEKLYLHGTAVDDTVCVEITRLRSLRALDLSGTLISQKGFEVILQKCKSLETLSARKLNFIVDEAIVRKSLPKLQHLGLDVPGSYVGDLDSLTK